MKVLFIEVRKKLKSFKSLNMEELKNLPKKLHILYSIQYKDFAEKIKEKLEKEKFEILAFQQVLGCSKIKPKASLLLIGSGKFHALSLLTLKKEIFIYDGKLNKIGKEEIEKFKARKKAKFSRFLFSKNIGLLFSTKPGQNKLEEATEIKNKLYKKFPDKNFYIFISDIINLQEFENFSLPLYINLACPGLELDSNKIMNYEEINSLI